LLDIKKLVQICTVRRYRSQTIIFKEGDLGTEMFIILFGSVRLLVSDSNGHQVETARLKAGDILGEMSLLENLPRNVTVETLEDTTTISVDTNNLENVIRQEPSLALKIMMNMNERIKIQNVELAKYKDQVCLTPQPLDKEPLIAIDPPITNTPPLAIDPAIDNDSIPPIVENEEDSKLKNISEGDDFRTLIQRIGKYNKSAPAIHTEYLFVKKIPCPVCGQTIEVKYIRSSKLRLKQVESDYRQVYTNFDPLWYTVWVCPYCYYANFNAEFTRISDQERKRIKGLSRKAKDIFGPYPTGPLSLTQVFTGYYLMLFWFEQVITSSPDVEKLGKIWLRLSWLFHDIQERTMSAVATKKALGYFQNLLSDITIRTTVAQDQYLYLLVGELSLKMGNITEAKNYFRQSIVINGGNIRMKQQAQDRLQDLKSSEQEKPH